MGYAIVLTKNITFKGEDRVNQITPSSANLKVDMTDITVTYNEQEGNAVRVKTTVLTPANATTKYTYELGNTYTGLSINSITGTIKVGPEWTTAGTVSVKVGTKTVWTGTVAAYDSSYADASGGNSNISLFEEKTIKDTTGDYAGLVDAVTAASPNAAQTALLELAKSIAPSLVWASYMESRVLALEKALDNVSLHATVN